MGTVWGKREVIKIARQHSIELALPDQGETLGKYHFVWGLTAGLERSFYPAGGGNEGGLVSGSLAPRGKQGTS